MSIRAFVDIIVIVAFLLVFGAALAYIATPCNNDPSEQRITAEENDAHAH
jgi:hypothetical protein